VEVPVTLRNPINLERKETGAARKDAASSSGEERRSARHSDVDTAMGRWVIRLRNRVIVTTPDN
jgi:hypothetical protein